MQVGELWEIPDAEIEWQFARSSGPGGQNVNKVASKVLLNWDMAQNVSIPFDVKERFRQKFGNRLTKEGVVQITSDSYRDQPRNRRDCEDKLVAMLMEVAKPPKKRRATKPTRSSVESRIKEKKQRADTKRTRQKKIDY